MQDTYHPYMLKRVLKEKGFNDNQIKLIVEALSDERVCSVCGAENPCYCTRDD